MWPLRDIQLFKGPTLLALRFPEMYFAQYWAFSSPSEHCGKYPFCHLYRDVWANFLWPLWSEDLFAWTHQDHTDNRFSFLENGLHITSQLFVLMNNKYLWTLFCSSSPFCSWGPACWRGFVWTAHPGGGCQGNRHAATSAPGYACWTFCLFRAPQLRSLLQWWNVTKYIYSLYWTNLSTRTNLRYWYFNRVF